MWAARLFVMSIVFAAMPQWAAGSMKAKWTHAPESPASYFAEKRPGGGPRDGGPWDGAHRHGVLRRGFGNLALINDLNLTDQQRKDIREIRQKYQPMMDAKRNAVREAEKNFREAMQNKNIQEQDLKNLNQKASDAHFNLMMERRAMMDSILAVLTHEQKMELEKKKAENPEGICPMFKFR